MRTIKDVKLLYNTRLAKLMGWTNIVELGGSLLGTPADGAPDSRGQAKIPDWSGCWNDCGEVIERLPDIHISAEILQKFRDGELGDVEFVQFADVRRIYFVSLYIDYRTMGY